jgi:zinc and cadmium transporter
MLSYILVASLLVMLASLGGKLLTWRYVGDFVERNLTFLVSFSAGVLLVVIWNLSREIIEHAGSLSAGIPWIVGGAVLVLVAFRYLPAFHHHHEHGDEHAHSTIDAGRILLSDSIHNVGDGILVAAAFSVSPTLGFFTALSVFLHEFVQEVSEFFVLREAGMSTNRALLYNFLTSSTILVGAIGGYFLLDSFEALEIPLLGIAAGSFLIVVFHDLIPHSIRTSHKRIHYATHIGWFIAGIALMTAIVVLVPHEEPYIEAGAAHMESAAGMLAGEALGHGRGS